MYKLLCFCFTIGNRRGAGGSTLSVFTNVLCYIQFELGLRTTLVWVCGISLFTTLGNANILKKLFELCCWLVAQTKILFTHSQCINDYLHSNSHSIYSSFLFVCFSGMYVCPPKMIDSLESLCHSTTVCKLFPQLSNGNHSSGWL